MFTLVNIICTIAIAGFIRLQYLKETSGKRYTKAQIKAIAKMMQDSSYPPKPIVHPAAKSSLFNFNYN